MTIEIVDIVDLPINSMVIFHSYLTRGYSGSLDNSFFRGLIVNWVAMKCLHCRTLDHHDSRLMVNLCKWIIFNSEYSEYDYNDYKCAIVYYSNWVQILPLRSVLGTSKVALFAAYFVLLGPLSEDHRGTISAASFHWGKLHRPRWPRCNQLHPVLQHRNSATGSCEVAVQMLQLWRKGDCFNGLASTRISDMVGMKNCVCLCENVWFELKVESSKFHQSSLSAMPMVK